MKKLLFLSSLMVLAVEAKSQRSDYDSHYLKPILKSGTSYFYDTKKLHNGYAIQVPLQSVNDELVNNSFKRYERTRRIGRFSYLIPLGYLFAVSSAHAVSSNKQISQSEANISSALIWGAFFTNIGCNFFSNAYLKDGIDRYNDIIFKKNSIGFKLEASRELSDVECRLLSPHSLKLALEPHFKLAITTVNCLIYIANTRQRWIILALASSRLTISKRNSFF